MSPREGEGNIVEELALSGASERELYRAVSDCLVSPHTDGEVGWVHVVAHLEMTLVPQLNLRGLYLCVASQISLIYRDYHYQYIPPSHLYTNP